VQTAVDDLSAALAAQPNGGPAATVEKRDMQEALIVWEAFKIYGGDIHAVEAFMWRCRAALPPAGTRNKDTKWQHASYIVMHCAMAGPLCRAVRTKTMCCCVHVWTGLQTRPVRAKARTFMQD